MKENVDRIFPLRMEAMKRLVFLMLSLVLALGLGMAGCEGPAGPEGPSGSVGPAGEDGSKIYAGNGPPGEDIGSIGDYYLDQNTGELYGPKDSEGWGDPSVVLAGEDGEDGKDGSQIYSGNGAPDDSLGVTGDYYLDKTSYELYGPKTSSGWGTPLNLKGVDGNANATLYLFPGYDFGGSSNFTNRCIELNSEQELRECAWIYYLVSGTTNPLYYSVPGFGAFGGEYLVGRQWGSLCGSSASRHVITCVDGTCGEYDEIHILRIEASNVIDNRSKRAGVVIPDDLDLSDYREMMGYYGFSQSEPLGR